MNTKEVWMLEDDSDDRYIAETTLAELKVNITLRFFSKADELFAQLKEARFPSLLLIDYNSAPDNGIEVLKRLKADKEVSSIPVVILSDNNFEQYAREAYAHGASSFIKKPSKVDDTRNKIDTFFKYWLEVAEV